jgi:hypothetical protein
LGFNTALDYKQTLACGEKPLGPLRPIENDMLAKCRIITQPRLTPPRNFIRCGVLAPPLTSPIKSMLQGVSFFLKSAVTFHLPVSQWIIASSRKSLESTLNI